MKKINEQIEDNNKVSNQLVEQQISLLEQQRAAEKAKMDQAFVMLGSDE